MKKIADFLVDKRHIILAAFLLLAIVSLFLMGQVNVNYDMTKYLPDDSSMKQGMDIMEQEFGETQSSTLRLMFGGLSEDDKQEIYDHLSELTNNDSISFDADSEDFNKDGYTLYEINMAFDSHSEECAELFDTVKDKYSDNYEIYTSGSISDANTPTLSVYIVVLALVILMAVLFAMSDSWFEPVIFLANIAVAVVINMGTNAFLPSIADTTNSVVAILQLVLSMDYSIILMNRYIQEKETAADNITAMKNAVANAFPSITSSSLTTFVGLLALVFMSFKIGADMGIALAKSVLISLICIFTVLPSLILVSDKLIVKLRKKALHISMGGYAKISAKYRYFFGVLLVCVFAAFAVLKGNTEIMYTLTANNKVDEIFPSTNSVVMLYSTEDGTAAGEIAEELEKNNNIVSVTGYYNTLGKEYTADELADIMSDMDSEISMDTSVTKLLYYSYFEDGSDTKIPLSDMLAFMQTMAQDEQYSDMIDESMTSQLQMLAMLTDKDVISAPMSAQELAGALGLDSQTVSQLMMISGADSMSLRELVDFLINVVLADPNYAAMFDQAAAQQLYTVQSVMSMSGAEYTASEFAEVFGQMSEDFDENTAELLYLYYNAQNNFDSSRTMILPELINYVADDVVNDSRFSGYFDDEAKGGIEDIREQLDEGISQLKGEGFGRIIINTSYPEDSAETRAFLDKIISRCDEELTGGYYLIGNSPMSYEMSQSFNSEMNRITIITAIAIFVVVAVTFRSFIIPLILVLVVQCGVFAAMTIIGISGEGMYYLALLIVQCILMGATIDYGILFTSYYRSNRKTMDIWEAILRAYDGSMHTILTSSLIMITVTGILGFVFSNPTIGEICLTIAKGAFCATVLIIFILPGILACADRFIGRNKS
ncbi:MAG: efflux RND transporter permease subunit [Oscillospiraceae bacterium]